MNIIYIHSHDTGRYVQPYGHAIPTPNLQKLADEGAVFRHCHCANPTCSPSRAALLTGQYAHSCGMLGLLHRGWDLAHPERHLANTLKAAGYETALAGIQHVAQDVAGCGYTRLLIDEWQDEEPEERAVRFLEASSEQPFFLDVGFIETHRHGSDFWGELAPSERADPRYVQPPVPFPDNAQTRADMAAFIDSAQVLDAKMGRVFAAVDELGLRENTLIVCTTDHGIPFPNMKCNLTGHGTGVMLIIRGPGEPGCQGGRVFDSMVSHLDLFPTVCEWAGVPEPNWLQGRSLLPVMRGDVTTLHDAIFSEVNYHASYEPMRSIRTERWTYICRYSGERRRRLANCDAGLTRDWWSQYGWEADVFADECLYDHVFDPSETANLARSDAHADVLAELRSRLHAWQVETDDPILNGDIKPPEGARVTTTFAE